MNDWANRRKNIYLFVVVIFLSTISFYIFWKFWYRAPSCFDGVQNGSELGVDCGGACDLVCSATAIEPIVRWDPRIFEVSPGVFSLLIYVENRNIDSVATYLPYTFTVYDKNNSVLMVREGATILPKNKTTGIFEGGLTFKDGEEPSRVIFDIGKNIIWKKSTETDPKITIKHSPLLRENISPRVEATVKNEEIKDIENIELIVAVFDSRGNAIATSRTFIEKLKAESTNEVFFTWPKPFDLGEKSCDKPSDVVVALDRSGSMASISKVPTEPLNSVKDAALYFITQLKNEDKVGLVSFATDASVDSALTNNFNSIFDSIKNIYIKEQDIQYTNIYDALVKSKDLIKSDDLSDQRQKIIVLLTDGIATKPSKPSSKSESEDILYATKLAEDVSSLIKSEGFEIYTVGLGKDIDKDFLSRISSGKENFLESPSTTTLRSVYKQISTSICKELPSRIEITYRIFGNNKK